jgi:uncharacterized coiled-coil protein SlyX
VGKKDITLSMELGGHGALLIESSRAYLHTGNPSCFISSVLEGVRAFRQEQMVAGQVSQEDRQVMDRLEFRLRILQQDLRALEDHVYAVPELEERVRE